MNLIGKYQNGNYIVSIFDDGTKIRENDLDFFDAAFPESMDIKITNRCNMGCKFCHEDSKLMVYMVISCLKVLSTDCIPILN